RGLLPRPAGRSGGPAERRRGPTQALASGGLGMSAIIEARRIMLARRGRTMTLRRVAATTPAVSYASVTGTGYSRVLPADPPAGVAQGRLGQLAIEMGVPDADPDGYGSPRSGDEVLDNGASYGV